MAQFTSLKKQLSDSLREKNILLVEKNKLKSWDDKRSDQGHT